MQGLEFDNLVMAAIRAEGDPLAPLRNSRVPTGGPLAAILRRFGRPRDPVARFAAVSGAARIRWAHEDTSPGYEPYRPPPLAPLAAELARWRDEIRNVSR